MVGAVGDEYKPVAVHRHVHRVEELRREAIKSHELANSRELACMLTPSLTSLTNLSRVALAILVARSAVAGDGPHLVTVGSRAAGPGSGFWGWD